MKATTWWKQLPTSLYPFTPTRGLFRINWTAGAINLWKKHCNPGDWPHPSFLWRTPTWQRHHSIEWGTCLCPGQPIHVCREVLNGAEICFCICGTFCVRVVVCAFGKSLLRVALGEILHFSVRFFIYPLFWTHLLKYTQIYFQHRPSISFIKQDLHAANPVFRLFFLPPSSHDLALRV